MNHPSLFQSISRAFLIAAVAVTASGCLDSDDDDSIAFTPTVTTSTEPGSTGTGTGTTISTDLTGSDTATLNAVDCNGIRVWEGGASDINENRLFFQSDGADAFVNDFVSQEPCLVSWEYDVAANCSLAYTVESYLSVAGINAPEFISAGVLTSGALQVTLDENVFEFPQSGVSFSQLFNIPDCPVSSFFPDDRLRKLEKL